MIISLLTSQHEDPSTSLVCVPWLVRGAGAAAHVLQEEGAAAVADHRESLKSMTNITKLTLNCILY